MIENVMKLFIILLFRSSRWRWWWWFWWFNRWIDRWWR
jgi:hypothetical protein